MKVISRVNIIVIFLSHAFSSSPDTSDTNIKNESIRPHNKSPEEFENKRPLFGQKIANLERKSTNLINLNKGAALESTTSLVNSLLFRVNPESIYVAKKFIGEPRDQRLTILKYSAIAGFVAAVILVAVIIFVTFFKRKMPRRQRETSGQQRRRRSDQELKIFSPSRLNKSASNRSRSRTSNSGSSNMTSRLLSDFISPYGHKWANNHNSGGRHSSKTKNIKKERIRGSAEEHQLLLTEASLKKGEVSDLKRKSISGKKSSRDTRLLSDFISPHDHKRTNNHNSGGRHSSKTKNIKKERIRGSPEEHQLLLTEASLKRGEVSDLKRKSISGKKSSRDTQLLSDFMNPCDHKRTNHHNSGGRHSSKTKNIKKERIRGSAEEHQLLLTEEPLWEEEVSDLKRKSANGNKSSRDSKRPHR